MLKNKLLAAAISGMALGAMNVSAAEISLMPNGENNLRNLKVAPEGREAGARGQTCPFVAANFTYPIGAVFSDFSRGKLTVWTRTHRQFVHIGNSVRLYSDADKQAANLGIAHVKGPRSAWKKQIIEWDANSARITADGQTRQLRAAPKEGWKFDRFDVCGYIADEIELELPEGTLRIDWENDFWAKVSLQKSAAAAKAYVQLTGFGNYFVSGERDNRDCPAVNIVNPSGAAEKVALEFDLTSELTGVARKWTRQIAMPPRSSQFVFPEFPVPLDNDVYHLTVKCGEQTFRRHFVHALKRGEQKGDVMFGLHCGARDHRVCANPSALPLDYDHWYFSWAYVCVVPWAFGTKDGVIVDKKGTRWGEDPNRPVDDWNWGTNESLVQGRKFIACINETPQAPWQRQSKIGTEWWQFGDLVGGEPNYAKLEEFCEAVARRGGKNLMAVEVGNEPNAGTLRNRPDVYANCITAEAKGFHKVNPETPLFVISGTGTYEPFMRGAIKHGFEGAAGLSLHTYTCPRQPEDVGLAERIRASRAEMAAAGVARYGNTETGVQCVGRDVPEKPLDPEYVAKQVKERTKGFFCGGGWPGDTMDEWAAARSMTKNAAINFAEGAEFFTYFGWNHGWIVDNWREKDQVWTMITGTPSGERAPTYFALGMGVQIEQMQGVVRRGAEPVKTWAALGGRFNKANGGALYFLWANRNLRKQVRIASRDAALEVVSMLGRRSTLKPETVKDGKNVFLLELAADPVYIHSQSEDMRLLPALANVALDQKDTFRGVVRLEFERGAKADGAQTEIPFDLEKNPNRRMTLKYVADALAYEGEYELETKPMATVKRVQIADPKNLESLTRFEPSLIDRNAQVVVGAKDETLSLQDPTKWLGPHELSAKVWTGCDDKYFYIYAKVRDAQIHPPADWPGVWGTSVELFLDMRTEQEGAGEKSYGPKVAQFLLMPAAGKNAETRFCAIQSVDLSGFVANSGQTDEGYWFSVAVPWSFGGYEKAPAIFRGDVCINGSRPKAAARKSAMALYGNGFNCADASVFGVFVVEPQ